MTEKTVKVPNISCGHCVATIEREVGEMDGVQSVCGRADARDVTITWDPDAADWVAIENHMKEIGYPPEAG